MLPVNLTRILCCFDLCGLGSDEALVGDKTDEVELYRAVATWKARSPREISFACGDRVEVIEKNMNGMLKL